MVRDDAQTALYAQRVVDACARASAKVNRLQRVVRLEEV